jgi:hypothetical protein
MMQVEKNNFEDKIFVKHLKTVSSNRRTFLFSRHGNSVLDGANPNDAR